MDTTTQAIDQVPSPGMDVTMLDFKLTCISSPGLFWTHYGDVDVKLVFLI